MVARRGGGSIGGRGVHLQIMPAAAALLSHLRSASRGGRLAAKLPSAPRSEMGGNYKAFKQLGTVQFVEFCRDELGYLRAFSTWTTKEKAPMYEVHIVDELPLGTYCFGPIKVCNALQKYSDLGAYNPLRNSCQTAALSLLRHLGIPREGLVTLEEELLEAAEKLAGSV
ncbi:hypothetical protein HPB52_025008 [Rhipicephalus sanguineus]|uniref:Uncharacterized protein n=1 Tax=Rhipicephalus sanguineus TaxID=34632 RepID=A0A9D4TDM0_RHISA|nr:hypothetical protein HPB52_025008 [Rhipicephalus sanguineus]